MYFILSLLLYRKNQNNVINFTYFIDFCSFSAKNAKIRMEMTSILSETVLRSVIPRIPGEFRCDIPFSQDLDQFLFCITTDMSELRKIPGILSVIDRDLIPLIQDHIPRFRRDLFIASGQFKGQRTDFFEAPIV